MSCAHNVFKDYVIQCPDSLKVNVLLSPATTYKWVITDKFGKQYSGEETTNGNGFLEIDVEDLPIGLLTSYAGEFKLTIFETATPCRQVNFLIGKYVDTIQFEVQAGTNVKDNLGCEFDCIASNGGNSAVFPFNGMSTVEIEWTTLLNSLYGAAPTVQVYHEITPGVYQLATVSVELAGTPLDGILIDNGGPATGYVLVS